MKYMATYDMMEAARNTNEWFGATARAFASNPVWGLSPNPAFKLMAAWGRVTERSFARMVIKPDWGIRTVVGEDGRDHLVEVETAVARAFGDLVHFKVLGQTPRSRKVMIVAPMSGHYATLVRSTVVSLLPDCDVYVTDWHNARDIPVSEGKFDIEDYTLYLVDFLRHLGPDTHVVAICQPAPLTLAATAYLAEEDPSAQPRSLILIGGPIDPEAAATDVTDFGHSVTMGQLEQFAIQRVGFKYAGAGRLVYPGLLQLAGFMSMNADRHSKAFSDQIMAAARGLDGERDPHNTFYDEYLAVMDMTAEFYLSTVERIFKNCEVGRNKFTVEGRRVNIGAITSVAVMTVEGANDDISAPGQCVAALDLCTGLPESKKVSHLEPGAGHYGIFAGKSWRNNIRPLVLKFIDANSGVAPVKAKPAAAESQAPEPVAAETAVAPAAPAPRSAAPAKAPRAKAAKTAKAAKVADVVAAPAPAVTAKPVAAKPITEAKSVAEAKPAVAEALRAVTPAGIKAAADVKPVETKPAEAKPLVEIKAPGAAPKAEPEAKPALAVVPPAELPKAVDAPKAAAAAEAPGKAPGSGPRLKSV